jgi:cytochrome P450
MLLSWSKECKEKRSSASPVIIIDNLENWVTKLALHIISAAGFGHKMQWQGYDSHQPDPNAETSMPKVTFAESLKTFVDEIFVLFIFPKWFLKFSPSAHLRKIHKAPDIFSKHVQQAINEARSKHNMEQGYENKQQLRKNDLLSNMINSGGSHGSDKGRLSDQEIIGNVFIFTLAGHETTATTIQTALVLLALHPELQQEIQDELDIIYGARLEGEGLVYESDYPKMRRVMALMVKIKIPAICIPRSENISTNSCLIIAGNPPLIPCNIWYS